MLRPPTWAFMKIHWFERLRISTWSYGGRQYRYLTDEDLLSGLVR
ncbi:hypothetical protein D915_006705 [Fasciola hepatica]|uniref:Uncharacterized protein n=1 Tax=Fasciola hepatica TaxID=6192 RepID=A0A4E0R948_FASHE|nr:hypothetical protein D915_006705 [Fasciola hepatica]